MKELIEKIAKGVTMAALLRCEVLDVGADTCDVRPLNGDADILGVKLKPVIDGVENSMVVFPKVGSLVVVGFVNSSYTDAYLLMTSEFDLIQFENGANEGLVKLPVLRDEINKLNNFVTAIKNTFTNWVPVPNDGAAALKTAMTSALANQQTADLSQAGNDKIKH